MSTANRTKAAKPSPSGPVLDYLQHRLPAYPFEAELDAEFVEELLADFPDVEILEEIKAFRWYYAQGTPSNPRLARIRLRRWLHNAKHRPRSRAG